MLARRSVAIVSGTPSCSLSSIAVAPETVKSSSISSYAFCSATSLASPGCTAAASIFLLHAWYSSAGTSLYPRTRVRSPADANVRRWASSVSTSLSVDRPRTRGSIRSSAPFVYSVTTPVPRFRNRIDIIFRSLSNSITCRISCSSVAPVVPVRAMVVTFFVRCRRENPIFTAAFTSASSSGDAAAYRVVPSALVSMDTVWQRASERPNCVYAGSVRAENRSSAFALSENTDTVGSKCADPVLDPPQVCPPSEQATNSMMLSVSVPVLSVSTLSICPRSSAIAVLFATAGVPPASASMLGSYMLASHPIARLM
eukprot:gene16998-biopygen17169